MVAIPHSPHNGQKRALEHLQCHRTRPDMLRLGFSKLPESRQVSSNRVSFFQLGGLGRCLRWHLEPSATCAHFLFSTIHVFDVFLGNYYIRLSLNMIGVLDRSTRNSGSHGENGLEFICSGLELLVVGLNTIVNKSYVCHSGSSVFMLCCFRAGGFSSIQALLCRVFSAPHSCANQGFGSSVLWFCSRATNYPRPTVGWLANVLYCAAV